MFHFVNATQASTDHYFVWWNGSCLQSMSTRVSFPLTNTMPIKRVLFLSPCALLSSTLMTLGLLNFAANGVALSQGRLQLCTPSRSTHVCIERVGRCHVLSRFRFIRGAWVWQISSNQVKTKFPKVCSNLLVGYSCPLTRRWHG